MADITILPVTPDITADWTEDPVGPAWSCIDEDVSGSPSDIDFIETTTIDAVCAVEFADSPANLSECTALTVSLRGVLTDESATALVEVAITHTGGTVHLGASPYDVTGANFGGYGTAESNYSIPQITGLNLTKTEIDSLRVGMTFRAS